MAYKDYSWTTKEQIKLYAQAWMPDGQVKAVLVLLHGLGEHSGRYLNVATMLNREGYARLGLDLRGHGKSEGPRGHFSFEEALDDMDLLISKAQKISPGTPIYLYGHSLGGNLVLYYAMKRLPTSLQGIIVTGPALGTGSPIPGWKLSLAKLMKGINPTMTMDNGLDVTGLSRNPNVVSAYKSDPLVYPLVSVRLGWDLIQSGHWLIEHAAEYPSIPLLIMQGSADRIVDPAATEKFVKNAKGNITFRLWQGDYHELHNEPNRDEVFNVMLHWLNETSLPKAKAAV